jgi:tRNA (guanine6-N2)-methyltransferase
MNHLYLSTFITGFKDVVVKNLSEHINISKIDLILDGLIVYQTNFKIEKIKKINYLNNTFILFKKFGQKDCQSTNQMLKSILKGDYIYEKIFYYIKSKKSFRIIISKENQLISVNKNLLKKIEDRIKKNKNLKLDRSRPDIEFWLLIRSEGVAFFCMRLTKKPNQEKYLEKGELRPELASIFCLVSEPQSNDIFLDPFCGHGSIPIQRLFIPGCEYKQIIASDNSRDLINKLENKIEKIKKRKTIKNFIIKLSDALNLSFLLNNSINKIVTDPPWGLRASKIDNINEFQDKMMNEFQRILCRGGILVILAKKEIFDKVLEKNQRHFELIKEYTTLVSGQKASLYKLRVIK